MYMLYSASLSSGVMSIGHSDLYRMWFLCCLAILVFHLFRDHSLLIYSFVNWEVFY